MTRTVPDMTDAPCARVDPNVFFKPEGGGRHKDWETPRAICRTCPLAAACLAYAIDSGDQHAMLAGLTPDERREYLLPAKPPLPEIPHGTVAGEKAHRRRGEKPCPACRRACLITRRIREDRARSAA